MATAEKECGRHSTTWCTNKTWRSTTRNTDFLRSYGRRKRKAGPPHPQLDRRPPPAT